MPFFVPDFPFRPALQEIIMDDDVINISNLSADELREELRHLSDLTSCPCYNCQRICNRWDYVQRCTAYQLWYEERMEARERHGRN